MSKETRGHYRVECVVTFNGEFPSVYVLRWMQFVLLLAEFVKTSESEFHVPKSIPATS